jgi:hypothetical protein
MENANGPSDPPGSPDAPGGPRPADFLTPPTSEDPVTTPTPPVGFGPPPGYPPPPGYWWGGGPAPGSPSPTPAGRDRGVVQFLKSATLAWILVVLLIGAVSGLSVALATQNSGPVRFVAPGLRTNPGSQPFSGGASGGGSFGTNGGRFGQGFGNQGVNGTVAAVGSSSFTVTASSGQTVTVDEQASTTYERGRSTATVSAITKGARVLVQGTRSGDTVKATHVTVLSAGAFGSASPG